MVRIIINFNSNGSASLRKSIDSRISFGKARDVILFICRVAQQLVYAVLHRSNEDLLLTILHKFQSKQTKHMRCHTHTHTHMFSYGHLFCVYVRASSADVAAIHFVFLSATISIDHSVKYGGGQRTYVYICVCDWCVHNKSIEMQKQ